MGDQTVYLDTSQPLVPREEFYDETGIDGAVIADIKASYEAGQGFLVVDRRDSVMPYETPFELVSYDFAAGEGTGTPIPVPAGKLVVVGRDGHGAAELPITVSRRHFGLLYNSSADLLELSDLQSANGTYVTGTVQRERPDLEQLERVSGMISMLTGTLMEEAAVKRDGYELPSEPYPYGKYREHHIIGRYSDSVKGGVYGTWGSELMVVDDESLQIQQLEHEFAESLPARDETLEPRTLLITAGKFAARTLAYDLQATHELSKPHFDGGFDMRTIALSEYVRHGVGVCRHQAVLTALLVENMIERGYLRGSVNVERNSEPDLQSAHAWAVYRDDKTELIIDPTNRVVDTRARAHQRTGWDYTVDEATFLAI